MSFLIFKTDQNTQIRRLWHNFGSFSLSQANIGQLISKELFKKDFLKFSFAPKNEQKYFFMSALAYKKRSNKKVV